MTFLFYMACVFIRLSTAVFLPILCEDSLEAVFSGKVEAAERKKALVETRAFCIKYNFSVRVAQSGGCYFLYCAMMLFASSIIFFTPLSGRLPRLNSPSTSGSLVSISMRNWSSNSRTLPTGTSRRASIEAASGSPHCAHLYRARPW
jgi:hypothetical protein